MNLHPDPRTEPVTVRQAIGRDGWIDYRRGYSSGSVIWARIFFSEPSPAIRTTYLGWRPNISGEERQFTMIELKTIAGFPETFRFKGNRSRPWKLIGNSVPPLMMRAIAMHVSRSVLVMESGAAQTRSPMRRL